MMKCLVVGHDAQSESLKAFSYKVQSKEKRAIRFRIMETKRYKGSGKLSIPLSTSLA